ncbi:MAG: universal stress protein [Flavobacteriales bacterium]|nr:universal stress protein [Flavobacteriales bacterium]
MKKIAVLVDFTRSGKPAMMMAKRLSEISGAEIIAVNISDGQHNDEVLKHQLDEYTSAMLGQKITSHAVIGHGRLLSSIPQLLSEINPDLVVICTHGIRGVIQTLFGATILKLVQEIHYPSVVVQENTVVRNVLPVNILLTASPYESFYAKMKYCGTIAKSIDANVVHYEMEKYLGDTEEVIAKHSKEAEAYYSEIQVKFSTVNEERKLMSLGFAQQTINYAYNHGYDLVCVSADTHQEQMAMGKADKEKMLCNDEGVAILVCPDK